MRFIFITALALSTLAFAGGHKNESDVDAPEALPIKVELPGCQANGLRPVKAGVIMLWEPKGCRGKDGFVQIENKTRFCIRPIITGINQPIVINKEDVPGVGENLDILYGVRTATKYVTCIPAHTNAFMFTDETQIVVTGVGYKVGIDGWLDAPWVITGVNKQLNQADATGTLPSQPVGNFTAGTYNLNWAGTSKVSADNPTPEIIFYP